MQWKNKKVIVTGGAGLIGRELVKKLLEKGAVVRCFDVAEKPKAFAEKVQYRKKDLSKLNYADFTGFYPEFIFHLGAILEDNRKNIKFWEQNFLNNILLSHKVIDAAKECKNLKKFIFASSYLIYDPFLYFSKKAKIKPVKLRRESKINPKNLYAVSKYYTERELEYLRNLEERPLKSVSARIFRVYGRGSTDIVSQFIKSALEGNTSKIFSKESSFDYIFAEDVAKGLLKLAENDSAQGAVNLGCGRSREVGEVVEIIKKQMSFPIKIKAVKKQGFFERSSADISKLKKTTGWKPKTSLEQGIKIIIDYETKQKNKSLKQ